MNKLYKFLVCASLALCLNAEAGSPTNLSAKNTCHVISNYFRPDSCDHVIFISNVGTKTIWVDLKQDDGKNKGDGTYLGRIAVKPGKQGTLEWMASDNLGKLKISLYKSSQTFYKGGYNSQDVCLKGTDSGYAFFVNNSNYYCTKQ